MTNFILKNTSGSNLSLNILANTPAETLTNNESINLLEFINPKEITKALQFGELKENLKNGNISLIKNNVGFINKDNCNITCYINTFVEPQIIQLDITTDNNFSFNQQNETTKEITTYTKTETESLFLNFTSGVSIFYRIYYDGNILSSSNIDETSSYSFNLLNKTEICYIWYDGKYVYTFDLRQNSNTNWLEKKLYNNILKTEHDSGLNLFKKTTTGQVSISSGYLIQNTSKYLAENNNGTNPLSAIILYRNDDANNLGPNNWKTYENSSIFPFYTINSNKIAYNKTTNNIWKLEEATDGYYIPYWVVGTNMLDNPIAIIMGQNEFSTLESAKTNSFFENLILDNSIIKTFKPLYRIITQNATNEIVDIQDLKDLNLTANYTTKFKSNSPIIILDKFPITKGSFSNDTTNPLSIGSTYIDQSEIIDFGATKAVFRAIISTTDEHSDYEAFIDLYDINGAISTPETVTNSEINTGSSSPPEGGPTPYPLTLSAYEVDISDAFIKTTWSNPGVFEARLWIKTAENDNRAFCNSAEIIFMKTTPEAIS